MFIPYVITFSPRQETASWNNFPPWSTPAPPPTYPHPSWKILLTVQEQNVFPHFQFSSLKLHCQYVCTMRTYSSWKFCYWLGQIFVSIFRKISAHRHSFAICVNLPVTFFVCLFKLFCCCLFFFFLHYFLVFCCFLWPVTMCFVFSQLMKWFGSRCVHLFLLFESKWISLLRLSILCYYES
jgi:hypothetical protein